MNAYDYFVALSAGRTFPASDLDAEVVCNKCGYGGPRRGHGADGCPYLPWPLSTPPHPGGDAS